MTMPSSPSRYYFIYALIDPRSGKIRYVGCTWSPSKRLKEHLKSASDNGYKQRWIRTLMRSKLIPKMEILEVGIGDCSDAERAWILGLRQSGERLVNATDGGDGVVGYKYTAKRKQETASRSKRLWRESGYQENVRAGLRNCWANSPERKQKTAQATKKFWASPRGKEIIAARANPEFRTKVGVGSRAVWERPGHRERMSTSHRGPKREYEVKTCRCGKTLEKPIKYSAKQWNLKRYCSLECSARARVKCQTKGMSLL